MIDCTENTEDKSENNVRKLLLLLDRNLKEKFYIMKHDIEHLHFVTASLKGTGGLDIDSDSDDDDIFSNLEKQVLKSKNFTVRLIKNYMDNYSYSIQEERKGDSEDVLDKDEIFKFNKMLISHSRALSILSKQLDYLHKTISETSYSLPPVIEPIRKYKRKIDRDDLIVLKNILGSYKEKLSSICAILGCTYDESTKKTHNNPVIFIDYSAGTKLFEAAANKVVELGIMKDSDYLQDSYKDYNLEFIQLPYWAVKITEYVSAVAHEVVHLYLHKHKAAQSKIAKINTLKNKIVNKLSYILSDYYGVDEDVFIETMADYDLMEVFAEEIIADTLSLLIAGPSYYFTLFSQNISRYPLTPDIIHSLPLAYARIYALYYIIQNVIENDDGNRKGNDRNGKIFTQYWKEMFHSTKTYLDAITDENAIRNALIKNKGTENNFESVEQIVLKMGMQEDIGKTIAKEILLKFFQEKTRTINYNYAAKKKKGKVYDPLKLLRRLENTDNIPVAENGGGFNFVNIDLFAGTLLNIKNTNSSFFKENIGNIPEYLWNMSLYYFYNYDKNKQNNRTGEGVTDSNRNKANEHSNENKSRLPKLQVARLFGVKQRIKLFGESNNEQLYLREPEEWLFAKVDWMQVRRCMDKENSGKGNKKDGKDVVDYFWKHLSTTYDLESVGEENLGITNSGSICKDTGKGYLKKDFVLGDYDFLIKLNKASTRRCLDWPPMLKCGDNLNGNDDEKYCAPYTYKEYIVERVVKKSTGESDNPSYNKENQESDSPSQSNICDDKSNTGNGSYILKFIKLVESADDKEKNDDSKKKNDNIDKKKENALTSFVVKLCEYYDEVYLSNSWNTIFVKKYLKDKDNLEEWMKVNNLIALENDNKSDAKDYKNYIKVEDVQSFVVFEEQNDDKSDSNDVQSSGDEQQSDASGDVKAGDSHSNCFMLTTLIKTRGTAFVDVEKKLLEEQSNDNKFLQLDDNAEVKEFYHLSGISDYMINWKADSISAVEGSLKKLIGELSKIGKEGSDSFFSILTSFKINKNEEGVP